MAQTPRELDSGTIGCWCSCSMLVLKRGQGIEEIIVIFMCWVKMERKEG